MLNFKTMNWDKIMKPKYAWIFVGVLFIISLISDSGVYYLIKLKSETSSIKSEIKELEKESLEFEEKIKTTKDNPKLMELYARTKLGMVRPDETIYEKK